MFSCSRTKIEAIIVNVCRFFYAKFLLIKLIGREKIGCCSLVVKMMDWHPGSQGFEALLGLILVDKNFTSFLLCMFNCS